MLRSIHTARSAAARRLSTFAGQSYYRTRIEPLESRHLLSATIIGVDTFADVVDAADGVTSLREAILAANASPDDYEIQLAAGTYALTIRGSREDAAQTGDLDILANGSLKILGADAELTTIDAAGLMGTLFGDRVLDVSAGAVLDLDSITLTGGNSPYTPGTNPDEDGGGIRNTGGHVTIARSSLVNNVANSSGKGGGIANTATGQVTITGSTISNNSAGGGGAIHNSDGGLVTITDSTVSANAGGGIQNSDDGVVTITSSTISQNTSGAIHNSDDGIVTITDSTVSFNSAYSKGAGIENTDGQVTIDHSTLEGNSILNDRDNAEGAGVYNDGGQVTIRHSTLAANSVTVTPNFGRTARGGGVYNRGGQVTISHSTLSGNSAAANDREANGGGIYNSGTMQFIQSTLADNTATRAGGGIYNGGQLTITDSTLLNNTADKSGGAIYNTSSLTITGSTLSGNISNSDGGAIFNTGESSRLDITLSKISDNAATYGGGIYNVNSAQLDITDSGLSDNMANIGGGGIFNAGNAQVTITGSTLSANTAHGDGGGIFNATGAVVTAINSTLSGNAANSFGGGIYNGFGGSPVTLRHSTLAANRADADVNFFGAGGGMYLGGGTVVALDHTIVAGNSRRVNTASDIEADFVDPIDAASSYNLLGDPKTAGGLAHGTAGNIVGDGLGDLLPRLLILDPNLIDNGGPTLTHALHIGSPAINAGDPSFDPNVFDPPLLYDQRGPGFQRVVEGRIDIGAYESIPNQAPVDGIIVVDVFEDSLAADGLWSLREAVIYANTHPGDFEIQLPDGTYPLTIREESIGNPSLPLEIIANGSLKIVGAGAAATTIDATSVGAIFFVETDAIAEFDGLTLFGAGGSVGGAIHNNGGQVTVTASVISSNLGLYGAIYNRAASQMTITDSIVTDNGLYAFIGVGGIGNYGDLTVIRTTISGNTGASVGGIANLESGQLTLIDSTVSGNSTGNHGIAGGIYNTGTAAITNSTISDNSVLSPDNGRGGGLYNDGTASIVDSTILNNAGGGIGNSGTVTITGSTVSGNAPHEVDLGGNFFFFYGGGGLHNIGSAMIVGSTFFGNSTSDDGGAIYNYGGTVSLTNATLSENTSTGSGGGIYNDDGTVVLTSSTISGNTSTNRFGGGIYNDDGTVSLTNATLSGNSARRDGGGIYTVGAGGQLTVRHTTITGNRARSTNTSSLTGGGLYLDTGATATLENTIVAGNVLGVAPGGTPNDIDGGGQLDAASSYNLIGDPATSGGLEHAIAGNIVGDGLGNLLNINFVLDTTLADNGGPTLTHALVVDSPAINAGDPLFDPNVFDPPLLYDQRGPGFPRVNNGRIDIGAFEFSYATVTGRYIFYNDSAFDNNNAGQNASDDNAIPSTKSAYLPGDGLAVYGNITNFTKGITGIMIDLAGGGDHASISANDFIFKHGNSNSPGTWATVATTPTVGVRQGGGDGGADRVTITWATGDIRNTWLEVQVLATPNTSLASADVHYWGNRTADSGESTPATEFSTTPSDASTIFGHLTGSATVDNDYDYNRSGNVTTSDTSPVFGFLGNIIRIDLPGPAPAGDNDGASAVASALTMRAIAVTPQFEAVFDTISKSASAESHQAPSALAARRPHQIPAQAESGLTAADPVGEAFDDDLLDSLLTDLKLW